MVKRVMVVDDSTTVRQEVVAILAPAGFEMIEAIDGKDGLMRLQSAPDIALVLCDVNMPKMGGIDMLRAAKDAGLTAQFIMLTTEGQPELIAQARVLGAKGWIVKPVNAEHLTMVVNKLTGSGAA